MIERQIRGEEREECGEKEMKIEENWDKDLLPPPYPGLGSGPWIQLRHSTRLYTLPHLYH